MNYFWEKDEVLGKLDVKMTSAFHAVNELSKKRKLYMRDAAYVIAISRVAQACHERGWVPKPASGYNGGVIAPESHPRGAVRFDRNRVAADSSFTFLGNGEPGGKAAGLASLKEAVDGRFPGGRFENCSWTSPA